MRHYFLRVLGWTSASTSMRWCLVDDTKRPGSCGGLCLRWCTWKLTHPHQSSNHLICPPIRRIPCCRTPASVPFNRDWTRKTVFAQEGGTVASTWDRCHANPHEKLDLLAAQDLCSRDGRGGLHPKHLAKLSDRLALGLDGVSQS